MTSTSTHPTEQHPELLLRAADAARLADVSRPAIRKAADDGRLRPVARFVDGRSETGALLFRFEDVMAWIAARRSA